MAKSSAASTGQVGVRLGDLERHAQELAALVDGLREEDLGHPALAQLAQERVGAEAARRNLLELARLRRALSAIGPPARLTRSRASGRP